MPITLVSAVVNPPEEDQGSGVVGNASSPEGKDADDEGNGSAGVEGKDSGAEGGGAASVGGAGSVDGSVGSVQAGRATSSTDSCACAAWVSVKRITATSADILPPIRRVISAVVLAAERAEKGAER